MQINVLLFVVVRGEQPPPPPPTGEKEEPKWKDDKCGWGGAGGHE